MLTIIAGYFYEVSGAKNLALFAAWFTIVSTPLLLMKCSQPYLKISVPQWMMDIAFDLCVFHLRVVRSHSNWGVLSYPYFSFLRSL